MDASAKAKHGISYTEEMAGEYGVMLGNVEIGKIRFTKETEQLHGGYMVLQPAGSGYAYPNRWEAEKELIGEFAAGAVYEVKATAITEGGRYVIAGQTGDGQFVLTPEVTRPAAPGSALLPRVLIAAPEELRGAIAGGLFYLIDAAVI